MVNYKQIYAIKKQNEKRWLAVNPYLNNDSGIYILTREENGFKFAYVGQAVHILDRLCQHLTGYQHIDLSLKKHGLFAENNPNGWTVMFVRCERELLDEQEQRYCREYANAGYQLRNKTGGSQGVGKVAIETKTPKGYYDGVKQGYKNARKEVAKLFAKSLKAEINGKETATKRKAMEKFNNFCQIVDKDDTEC